MRSEYLLSSDQNHIAWVMSGRNHPFEHSYPTRWWEIRICCFKPIFPGMPCFSTIDNQYGRLSLQRENKQKPKWKQNKTVEKDICTENLWPPELIAIVNLKKYMLCNRAMLDKINHNFSVFYLRAWIVT